MGRSDKATVITRVQEVSRLVLAGAEFADIRQFASDHGWQIGDRQVRRYIELVYERLAESTQRDREQLLGRHLMQRRALYARAVKSSDYRAALMILRDEAELSGLYPPTKVAPTTPDGQHPYSPTSPAPHLESRLSRQQRVVKRINAKAAKDKAELKLLRQVTPVQLYHLPDTMLPEQMLHILALQHVNEQLEWAGMYLFAAWSASVQQSDPDGWLEVLLATNAYLYKVGHDGWQLFVDRLGINGRWLIEGNYTGALLEICNENLLAEAPQADYVQRVLEQATQQPVNEVITADEKAKRWWRLFRRVCREPNK
jgi:hypothetical protein